MPHNPSWPVESDLPVKRAADDRNPTLLPDAAYFALRRVELARQKTGTVPARKRLPNERAWDYSCFQTETFLYETLPGWLA